MIKQIIQFSNGMVMVFDENGEQMPEYQGRRSEAIKKLSGTLLNNVEFSIGSWNSGTIPINKEQFFSEGWK